MNDYWLKQGKEPLFPDILWSRPETKAGSGKLAIIGGNEHAFGAPGLAYDTATSAGAGVCRVVLPDKVKKILKNIFPDADYAPSNRSGSFAKSSVGELLLQANWSDTTLLAGDFGRNSETAVVMESLITKYSGLLVIAQDAVDYFKESPLDINEREDTILVLSLAQLQRLFINTPTIMPITFSMDTVQLVDALHDYTKEHNVTLVTVHNELMFISHRGKVVTQKFTEKTWRVKTAAKIAVFWMQNPTTTLEAATTSIFVE